MGNAHRKRARRRGRAGERIGTIIGRYFHHGGRGRNDRLPRDAAHDAEVIRSNCPELAIGSGVVGLGRKCMTRVVVAVATDLGVRVRMQLHMPQRTKRMSGQISR